MFIKEVFEQFLSEQKSKLALKTCRDYASVIELFEHQLDGYAWNNIADGDKAYDGAKKKGESFIDLYDHTHIEENVGEFLTYFVPRKVMAGNEFILKTCPRVMRKLLTWMELVASFGNRFNLLKSWEKTDPCTVSSYGAYGPKKRSDHAHSRPICCHGVPPFF